jgi:hypothetical protein
MRTLFITSIYGKLWGTEFGGRPSREYHYRQSLLSVLKLNPTKCVCFTSKEELNDLREFFNVTHKIPTDKLEFIVFDLYSTKYRDKIMKLRNIEETKKSDRCIEVQYNKFFWNHNLPQIKEYDRVYWFDAGLSHGGIFPTQYQRDKTHEGHYHVSLFKPNYLELLNQLTEDKFLMVAKNNTGSFFWSQSLPQKYYKEYDRSKHIIGGFFGGNPDKFLEICKRFEDMVLNLLDNEESLYMEELIMTCMYFNDKNYFTLLEFDDWYKREHHTDPNIKYFYNTFINE